MSKIVQAVKVQPAQPDIKLINDNQGTLAGVFSPAGFPIGIDAKTVAGVLINICFSDQYGNPRAGGFSNRDTGICFTSAGAA